MLADCDVGNIVVAAQAGAQWRYAALLAPPALIPGLYVLQDLSVRLGIVTQRGYGELIRERFGPVWGWISGVGLAIAVAGSLVTEFTGIAGVGEMFGVSRTLALALAVAVLVGVLLTGSYRRIEKIAMAIGVFQLTFFAIAWYSRPNLNALLTGAIRVPFANADYRYLVAALIGATFNPWAVFYQQAAVINKRLTVDDYRLERFETAAGAVLTQALMVAIEIATAATLWKHGERGGLQSIGEISGALAGLLGERVGRLLFGIGALGAAMVAAIVCSVALAWGLGELTGHAEPRSADPFRRRGFCAVYACAIVASAALVSVAHNLVVLNIAAQVVNALLLPVVTGFLIAISAATLKSELAVSRRYIGWVSAMSVLVCAAGVVGGAMGL
jgi:Mn2+/Fe2+ NRAMP family transporter